jgi:hypothetical protein
MASPLQPLVGSRDHTNEMLVPFWRISGSRRKHELGLDAASLDGEGDGQVDGQSAICCFNDQIPFAQAKHNDEASGRNLNLKRVSQELPSHFGLILVTWLILFLRTPGGNDLIRMVGGWWVILEAPRCIDTTLAG